MRPAYEVAQIVRDYGQEFISHYKPLKQHQKVLHAIQICRTAYLGGHVDRCANCQKERIAYNSCRNRHCPKCQSTNRERWVQARKADLLDCSYFHVVFTLPSQINSYCLSHPKEMYNILFQSSKETMFQLGYQDKHLGAQIGMISLLHTWGQNLQLHPHVHMIVPGGGFDKDGSWVRSRSNGKFLFCVKAMSRVYRGKFMEKMRLFLASKGQVLSVSVRRILYDKEWVVYAKDLFLGPSQVIEYLGRYSHKIAISNHRIVSIADRKVIFKYKDYQHGNVTKTMELDAGEFLRRFCLHILPPRFVKIRHYGFLASRVKQQLRLEQFKMGILPAVFEKKDYKEVSKNQLGFDVEQCPYCKTGKMIRVLSFSANAPPMTLIKPETVNKIMNR